MKAAYGKPVDSDIYRCGLFIATQTESEPATLHLRHDRAESKCRITSYGILTRDSFMRDRLIYNAMREIVTNLSQDI